MSEPGESKKCCDCGGNIEDGTIRCRFCSLHHENLAAMREIQSRKTTCTVGGCLKEAYHAYPDGSELKFVCSNHFVYLMVQLMIKPTVTWKEEVKAPAKRTPNSSYTPNLVDMNTVLARQFPGHFSSPARGDISPADWEVLADQARKHREPGMR